MSPPSDWSELVEVGTALTDEDANRYGIALSATIGGQLGNEIQHWTNQGGGAINNLDNDGAREALAFYKALYADTQHRSRLRPAGGL